MNHTKVKTSLCAPVAVLATVEADARVATAYNSGFTHRSSLRSSLGASPNQLVGHGGCREAGAQPPVPASQVRKPAAVIRNFKPGFGGASCAAEKQKPQLPRPGVLRLKKADRLIDHKPKVWLRATSTSLIGNFPITRSISVSKIVARLSVITTESVSKPDC